MFNTIECILNIAIQHNALTQTHYLYYRLTAQLVYIIPRLEYFISFRVGDVPKGDAGLYSSRREPLVILSIHAKGALGCFLAHVGINVNILNMHGQFTKQEVSNTQDTWDVGINYIRSSIYINIIGVINGDLIEKKYIVFVVHKNVILIKNR